MLAAGVVVPSSVPAVFNLTFFTGKQEMAFEEETPLDVAETDDAKATRAAARATNLAGSPSLNDQLAAAEPPQEAEHWAADQIVTFLADAYADAVSNHATAAAALATAIGEADAGDIRTSRHSLRRWEFLRETLGDMLVSARAELAEVQQRLV